METPLPLDELSALDLTSVDANYPLLPAGTYRVICKDLYPAATKDGNGRLLRLQLALESTGAVFTNGKPANPGYIIPETISITPTEKYDPLPILARIQLAFLGTQGKIDWNTLKGQWADIKLKVDESTEFGNRNRVQAWLPKKATSVAGTI